MTRSSPQACITAHPYPEPPETIPSLFMLDWASLDYNTCRNHAIFFFSSRNSALNLSSSVLHALGKKEEGTIHQISFFSQFLFLPSGSCFLPFLSIPSLMLTMFFIQLPSYLSCSLEAIIFPILSTLFRMYWPPDPTPSWSSLLDFLSMSCLQCETPI